MSDTEDYLKSIDQHLHVIQGMMAKVVNYMVDAEGEVTERMRRFIMYMHDMHDVKNLYDEHGIEVPPWVLREVERCDDRLRQLLQELHKEGGTFAKVRREMASDPDNRYDHTRAIMPPKKEKVG